MYVMKTYYYIMCSILINCTCKVSKITYKNWNHCFCCLIKKLRTGTSILKKTTSYVMQPKITGCLED